MTLGTISNSDRIHPAHNQFLSPFEDQDLTKTQAWPGSAPACFFLIS